MVHALAGKPDRMVGLVFVGLQEVYESRGPVGLI